MAMRRIFNYIASDNSNPVTEFMRNLDIKLQKKLGVVLVNLKNTDLLQPPTYKAFRLDRYKGLYELRVKIKQMVRIVFYLDSAGDVVLLHGFVKDEDRATKMGLEMARARKLALARGNARKEEFLEVF